MRMPATMANSRHGRGIFPDNDSSPLRIRRSYELDREAITKTGKCRMTELKLSLNIERKKRAFGVKRDFSPCAGLSENARGTTKLEVDGVPVNRKQIMAGQREANRTSQRASNYYLDRQYKPISARPRYRRRVPTSSCTTFRQARSTSPKT
jgi:hypothetical protein